MQHLLSCIYTVVPNSTESLNKRTEKNETVWRDYDAIIGMMVLIKKKTVNIKYLLARNFIKEKE
jgi:hypothetical protein